MTRNPSGCATSNVQTKSKRKDEKAVMDQLEHRQPAAGGSTSLELRQCDKKDEKRSEENVVADGRWVRREEHDRRLDGEQHRHDPVEQRQARPAGRAAIAREHVGQRDADNERERRKYQVGDGPAVPDRVLKRRVGASDRREY